MPPQTHPKPAQGEESHRSEQAPKRNTPAHEGRTRKTGSPFDAEEFPAFARKFFGMQEAETELPPEALKALKKYIDMNKVQEEAASKPFVESKISDIRADIAERFGELKAILADVKADNADVKAAHAEQSSAMLRTIITALILMTGLLGLFIRFLPQPAPPTSPPVIVQTPPAAAVAETPPAADPPAPLPLDAE